MAGQVAPVECGQTTVRGQTRVILSRIDQLLADAGTTKHKLLSASVWLADIRTFDEMNLAWNDWIPAAEPPARATVEARLALPSYLVEIAVVAAIE